MDKKYVCGYQKSNGGKCRNRANDNGRCRLHRSSTSSTVNTATNSGAGIPTGMSDGVNNTLTTKGSLKVILSMMFGGKTTYALHIINAQSYAVNVLYINHLSDTRTETPFSTHNQLLKDPNPFMHRSKVTMIKSATLTAPMLDDDYIKGYSVICIDEAQFFDDLLRVIHWVDGLGKDVYVFGLTGTFDRENFGKIHLLLPHLDTIEILRDTLCADCAKHGLREKALFSFNLVSGGPTIQIGNNYLPLCRNCYNGRKPI